MRRATTGAVTTALVFATGLLAGCDGSGSGGTAASNTPDVVAASREPSPTTTPAPMSKATPTSVPSPTGKPARGKHNNADAAFAANFVVHRAQGIEMARLLLAKRYIDPAVRALASRIMPTQVPQIARLRGWLAGWGRPVPAPNGFPTDGTGDLVGRDPSLPGVMSEDDMAALRHLDGVEGAKLFLVMLVNHELGAIQLANDELAVGRNGDARKLARIIIDEEQARVTATNELLDGRIHPPGHY